MSGSVNKVILLGHIGADPVVRMTQDGKPIVNLSIATSETWRDKASGERKEKTEWHRVVIYNEGLAKVAEQYVKKGSQVYIEGQLQTRKWTDKDGVEKYSTEVVLQNFKGELALIGGRPESKPQDDGPEIMAPRHSDVVKRVKQMSGVDISAPRSVSRDLDDEVPF